MVRLIPQVFNHGQFLGLHLLSNLLQDLGGRDMVGKGGHYDLATLLFPHGAHPDRAVAAFIEFQQVFLRRDDFRVGREIRSFYVLTQLGNRGFGMIQQTDGGGDDFSQVMRWDVRGHAYRDAGAAVEQNIGQPCGQHVGFFQCPVKIGTPVHCAHSQFAQQRFGVCGQA